MINLSKFLRSIHITKFSFYLLILLIILSFSITFYLLLPNNQLVKDPQNLQFLLLADVIFVLVLLSMIIRQILLVFIYRKKNIGESRLYIKFVNLFTAMALGPAIGVVIITSLFFNLELRTWYGGAVRDAVVTPAGTDAGEPTSFFWRPPSTQAKGGVISKIRENISKRSGIASI